jgi:hypothetical protein
MTHCPGCNKPLRRKEPLDEIRTYHISCDPQGRVEVLEKALRETLKWATRMGYRDLEDRLSKALAYRPAQTKGRE